MSIAAMSLMMGCSPTALRLHPVEDIQRVGASNTLQIFGGSKQETYLGCLNCAESNPNSVLNRSSVFANASSSASLYNKHSQFASSHGNLSACSRIATNPPVVVTERGSFVGRLTLNRYAAWAITDPSITKWLNALCS
jgi:hypothetical protein